MPPIVIAAGIAAGGSLAGGALASSGAKSAAETQAAAGDKALALQKDMYDQTRQDLAPWVTSGSQANTTLSSLLSTPGQGLLEGFGSFTAPTGVTEANDPGYQFRADQQNQAVERSAAAKGTLLTGGTLKDLSTFGGQLASQEYGNVYNRALSEWANNMQNFYTGQSNTFGRLNSLSSMGQASAAGQANAAQNFGQNASNTITGIGNVQAAGQVASGNAWNQGINGASNDLLSSLLSQYYKPNTTSSYGQPTWNNPPTWDGVGTTH
jgi:hypothetical protein